MKQFLYKLTLIPELLEESNWTDKENNIISEHFHALQLLLKNDTSLWQDVPKTMTLLLSELL
ncbi:hypothetical protein [Bacillus sp. N1-1]|uniref:hypothetical protein n=1 Tax=Bacillus sp. N1-1 TaxID=2682541 RepID=UPI001F0F3D11|nr:hypothetical protein [Bacillus sp. N1-1]